MKGNWCGIKTYSDAFPYSVFQDLVKIIAIAKGLPKRVGIKEPEEFFRMI